MATSPHQQLAASYRLPLKETLAELQKMEDAASAVMQQAEGTTQYARRKLQHEALTTARQLVSDCLAIGSPGARKVPADPQLDLFGAAA